MASTLKSLRALADPTRLRLLALFLRCELAVAELQELLGMGQSRISAHLAQLKTAGLVDWRRSGKNVYYAAVPDLPDAVRHLVEAAATELPETADDLVALDLVLKRRADTAREYFDRLAGRFGKKYCPGRSWEALARTLLELLPPMVVADLGAGEGALSMLLARRARKVIAIDLSSKMTEYGSKMAAAHGYKNVEFRVGDIESPPIRRQSVDLALLSQALHHARSPEKAVLAAAAILKPGGRLVILDLLAHSFEAAREEYADLWLGFSEVELYRVLEKAGCHDIGVRVVAREDATPHFETVLATGVIPQRNASLKQSGQP